MPHFQEDNIKSNSLAPSTVMGFSSATKSEDFKSHSTSQSRDERTRIKNRRKRYLDKHPEYFTSADLELAGKHTPSFLCIIFSPIRRTNIHSRIDPLLYDRLVRRFQSAQERESDGRKKGYTGVLEADLTRSEAKLSALQNPDPTNGAVIYKRAPDGHILAVEQDEEASSKAEAWERWVDIMTQRFLRGGDKGFEYEGVDGNEEFDDREEEERREFEGYVGEQTPEFLGEGRPVGETGVQDF